jgi:hypothetical protein
MKNPLLIVAIAAASATAQNGVFIAQSDTRPLTVDLVGAPAMAIAGRAVKGMPYAAEAVNETTQILSDGNRISRKSASSVHRDSQGRTRNEMAIPAVGPWASGKGERIVNIFDPVAKVNIVLHPDKTAVRHEIPSLDGMTWTQSVSSDGNARTMVYSRRIENSSKDATSGGEPKQVLKDIVIERFQGPEEIGSLPRTGIGVAVAGIASATSGGNLRKESLGKKLIEGVEAEGTRTVSVIPAGEIGNERDIEVIDETWYSKEIEALVYSRHADPRTGETTYKLTNIQRGEQPLHLFEVPADYKLNADTFPRRMEIKRDKPNEE